MDEEIVATTECPLFPESRTGPSRDRQHGIDEGVMPTGRTAVSAESVDQCNSPLTGSTLPPPYSRYWEGRSAFAVTNTKSLDRRL